MEQEAAAEAGTRDIASAGRRAVWTVLDQALSSATNFGLAVVIARSVAPVEFGAYSVAFSVYLVVVGISRSLATDAYAVRYSTAKPQDQRSAASGVTGLALLIGAIGMVFSAAVGAVVSGPLGPALVAFGVGFPLLMVQDAWRFVFFAMGRPKSAVVNDAVWSVFQVLTVGAVLTLDRPSVPTFIAAWWIAGAGAAVVGAVQARVVPDPRQIAAWWRGSRDLAGRYAVDFAAGYGVLQIIFFVLAAAVGVSAVGALRGGQTILGPLNVLLVGVLAMAVPEGARLRERSDRQFRRAMAAVSVALMTAGILGGVVGRALPDRIGAGFLGDTWPATKTVLLPIGLIMAGNGATVGAIAGLRVLAAARLGLRCRFVSAAVTVGLAVAGTLGFGLDGAVWGLAGGVWIGAAVWWAAFHGARRANHAAHGSRTRSAPNGFLLTGEPR